MATMTHTMIAPNSTDLISMVLTAASLFVLTTEPPMRQNGKINTFGDSILENPTDISSAISDFEADNVTNNRSTVPCKGDTCDEDTVPSGTMKILRLESPTTLGSTTMSTVQDISYIVFVTIVAGCGAILGVVGNIAVICAIYIDRKLQHTTNYFLVSLAFSDLWVGMSSLPIYTIYLVSGEWVLGDAMCDAWLVLDWAICQAGQNTIFFITLDRYLSITSPIRHRGWKTDNKVMAMIIFSWVLPFSTYPVIILLYKPEGYVRASTRCSAPFVKDDLFLFVLSMFDFWIPTLFMCYFYWRIYRLAVKLHTQSRNRVRLAGESYTASITTSAMKGMGPESSFAPMDLNVSNFSSAATSDCDFRYLEHNSIMLNDQSSDNGQGHCLVLQTMFSQREILSQNDYVDEKECVYYDKEIIISDDQDINNRPGILKKYESRKFEFGCSSSLTGSIVRCHGCGNQESTSTAGIDCNPLPRPKPSNTPDNAEHNNNHTITSASMSTRATTPVASGLHPDIPGTKVDTIVFYTHSVSDKSDKSVSIHFPRKLTDIEGSPTDPNDIENNFRSKPDSEGTVAGSIRSLASRDRRTLRVISVVIGAYLVCWLPFHLVSMLTLFCGDNCVKPGLLRISYLLCYMNSPLNPFLYAFANERIRATMLRILNRPLNRN